MVKFNDLQSQWLAIKDNAMPEIEELMNNCQFILGPQVERFEKSFADYCGCRHAIGVSNGTDGIKIAAKAIGIHHSKLKVYMPANTFVATWLGIKDAYPHSDIELVDIKEDGTMDLDILRSKLETPKTYAAGVTHVNLVVAVHMFGNCDNLDEISQICEETRSFLMEDASQAHGATTKIGTVAGSKGVASVFSLYPGKNLGGCGDAGVIVTNDGDIFRNAKMLRNYGSEKKYIHEFEGFNHRLDSIQAIVLYWKLKHLEKWNENRKNFVNKLRNCVDNEYIKWILSPERGQVYHILPVRVKNRNMFQQHLDAHNVQHGIHYPIPIHQMSFCKKHFDLPVTEVLSKEMVSLPIHPFMTDDDLINMVRCLSKYKVETIKNK